MSATRYKKPHVDILICIEMTRERNQGIKKTPGTYMSISQNGIFYFFQFLFFSELLPFSFFTI